MNLKDLAHRLNLSPTTVSRALNGYPEVNEATRERVMAAAKEHNYHPNSRAIRLATGRAMAVGHVIAIANRHEIVNPVFADFIAGAGETTAAALLAVRAAAERLAREEAMAKPVLSSWQALTDYLRITMARDTREQFRVLFLNRKWSSP